MYIEKEIKSMKKYKWYAAVKKMEIGFYHCDIIKIESTIEPTKELYPQYNFMFGGYSTKRKAEQVAMYQNYVIDTPLSVAHLI